MTTSLTKYSNKDEMIVQSSWDILAENSKKSYKSDLDMFFEFVKKDLTDVNQADIINFVLHLKAKGYKNSSINRKIASVSKMFTVYLIVGAVKVNPVDLARKSGKVTLRVVKSNRSYLTLKDVQKCIEAEHVSRADRDIALMIELFLETGIRVSELINIEHKDITEINDKFVNIHIYGKGNVERDRPATKKLINRIKKIFGHDTLLFCTARGKKYNRSWVYEVLRKRFKRASGVKSSPHMLRHFYATYKVVVEKMDIGAVQKALGHSNPATTIGMYVHASLSAEESVIKYQKGR